MKKKILSVVMVLAMTATMIAVPASVSAAAYLVNDDFNSGTFESAGWQHYKSSTNATLTADVADGVLHLTGNAESGELPGIYKALNGTDGITCAEGELLEVKFGFKANVANNNASSIDLKFNTKDLTTSSYSQTIATLQPHRLEVYTGGWSDITYQQGDKVDATAYFNLQTAKGDWSATAPHINVAIQTNKPMGNGIDVSTIYDIGFFARSRTAGPTIDFSIDYVTVRKVKKAEITLGDIMGTRAAEKIKLNTNIAIDNCSGIKLMNGVSEIPARISYANNVIEIVPNTPLSNGTYTVTGLTGLSSGGVDVLDVNNISVPVNIVVADDKLTLTGEMYRYDKDTIRFKGEFLNPVAEATLAGNIAVTVNNTPLTDGVVYDLADGLYGDDMILTVDIPTGLTGGDDVAVTVNTNVKLSNPTYQTIGMDNDYVINYTNVDYLTAGYNGTAFTVANNSKVNQDYTAIAGKYSGDDYTAYFAEDGTINAEDDDSIAMDASGATGTEYGVLLDQTSYKPLAVSGTLRTVTAETDSAADYTKPSLDLVSNMLNISGILPSASQKTVVVTVYDPTNTNLLYAGALKSKADGYFTLNAAIDSASVSTSGYLKIKIGGDDFNTPVEINDVYYPLKSEQIQMVNDLRGASDVNAIKPLLTNAVQLLSMNLTPYTTLAGDATSLTKLATRVNAIKATIPEITLNDPQTDEKISQAQNILKIQAILECIQEGKGTLVAANGALLYNDIMKYSSIDDAQGVTLYNLYTNEINATGKTEVVNSLLNKTYQTQVALYDDLKKAIMLAAIKYPAKNGIGHIEMVLTKENADAVGITITKYLALTDTTQVDSAIANMQISTLADVENYIANLKAPTSPKPTGNGGGGFVAITPQIPVAQPENSAPEETVPEAGNENAGTQGSFGDVETSHWAYEAIEYLSKMGIINGKGNNEFSPDDTITRAEFVKILCLAMNIPVSDAESIFGDVDNSDWFAPFVMAAYEAGIINGIGDNIFGAKNNISREDLCTLLYRLVGAEFTGTTEFTDSYDIADYAKDAVAYAFEKGYVNGYPDNTFKPGENCTRAQAASIIYKFLGIEEN